MKPIFSLLLFSLLAGCSVLPHARTAARQPVYREITPVQADSLMKTTKLIIVDLRPEAAYPVGHLPGAISMQPDSIKTLDPKQTYLVYCGANERSQAAYDEMKQMGFSAVYRLVGGSNAWILAGYALTK